METEKNLALLHYKNLRKIGVAAKDIAILTCYRAQTICNYLSFKEENESADEGIQINAIVRLRSNYADFKNMYPNEGFFSLHEVQQIKYKKSDLCLFCN
ncbi:hypothetical protein CAEBREN_16584 [Caenorhabditis brenneri]|uniref:DUF7040 domain-containing protein n=1 Tax=Caenorhabditis brenneri TaxID=135651 RepID=G0P100_CAEBE|nr:hypothetical protein CAEBREN_16584 [Caenorhabditis brenneri]